MAEQCILTYGFTRSKVLNWQEIIGISKHDVIEIELAHRLGQLQLSL